MAIGSAIAATAAKIFASAIVKKIAVNILVAVATGFVAKKLGLFKPPKIGQERDPGVKIQLPPSTDNKIPVFYGRNIAGGIITHAELVNQNETMRYVFVLSEFVPGATYTVNRVFRNDVQLTVDTNGIVTGGVTRDGDPVTDIANKMRVYVYANGTAAQNQVFPVTQTPAAATARTGELTANTSMEGLVYLIFEINYDPEASLFDSGIISVDLENDVVNPADVLIDYLTNNRYGAGLAGGALDIPSFDNFRAYCDETVSRQDPSGTAITAPRWRINGGLSTFNTALENIQEIVTSSSAWFTYNPALGQYTVKINAQATQGEKDNALVFDDDNIVSKVDVSTTELYSLYNEVEAEYEDVNLLDQTNVVYVKTPGNQRKPGEPDNTLRVRYNMVNDLPRAQNLANIELRQSRFDKIVRFTSDYSGIELLSGDIFRVSNPSVGFEGKLFRCLRTLEVEDDSGRLLVEITGMEYDDSIYDHSTEREVNPAAGPGIPIFINNPDLGNVRANAIANIVVPGFQIGQIPPSVIDGLEANLSFLDGELANAANSINDLNTVTIPALELDLANLDANLAIANADIANLTNVTIPALQGNLSNLSNNLSNAQSDITTLNTVTIPALQGNLTLLEGDLANLDSELGNVFPITETNIANDSISTRTIQAEAVTALEIRANTITANQIASRTITALQIETGTITALEIDTDTITANNIAFNTITGDRIDTNTITANNIESGTITAVQIDTDTITANNIAFGTITGDRIDTRTILANNIGVGEITAVEIKGNTITANNIAFNTITGDRIAVNTITANKMDVAELSSIQSRTGTLLVDTIKTADSNTAQRVEFTGIQVPGGDATYALWSGANAKTDANASFYVKHTGDARFAGRVRAAQLEGSIFEAVPIRMTGGAVTNALSNVYVTVRNAFGEVAPQSARPVRPFMMVTVPVFGEGSPGAFLQAQIQVETSPGVFSGWQTVAQESSVNTDGFGSTITLAGGLNTFGTRRFRFRVQMRRFEEATYTGSPQANRYEGIFLGLPAGNGVTYQVEDTNVPFESPGNIAANTAILFPPDFGTGWEIEP